MLTEAANAMVAGVEVWLQAQQQLGVETDVPAAAVVMCTRHEVSRAFACTSGVPNLGRTQFGPKLTHAFCRETNAIIEVEDYINTFLRCLTAPNAPLLRLQ
jgi:hypothetical protein